MHTSRSSSNRDQGCSEAILSFTLTTPISTGEALQDFLVTFYPSIISIVDCIISSFEVPPPSSKVAISLVPIQLNSSVVTIKPIPSGSGTKVRPSKGELAKLLFWEKN